MDALTIKEAAEGLRTTVWSTQGARFAARRRMLAMSHWSLASISVGSIYVIGLSLLPHFAALTHLQTQWASLLAIMTAIGILVLSLLEAGQHYEVRAERLHECGLDLGSLCGDLDVFLATGCEGGFDALEGFRRRYDQILRDHKENHHTVDYDRFRASKPDDFNLGRLRKVRSVVRWSISAYWRSAALMILPFFGFLLLISR